MEVVNFIISIVLFLLDPATTLIIFIAALCWFAKAKENAYLYFALAAFALLAGTGLIFGSNWVGAGMKTAGVLLYILGHVVIGLIMVRLMWRWIVSMRDSGVIGSRTLKYSETATKIAFAIPPLMGIPASVLSFVQPNAAIINGSKIGAIIFDLVSFLINVGVCLPLWLDVRRGLTDSLRKKSKQIKLVLMLNLIWYIGDIIFAIFVPIYGSLWSADLWEFSIFIAAAVGLIKWWTFSGFLLWPRALDGLDDPVDNDKLEVSV